MKINSDKNSDKNHDYDWKDKFKQIYIRESIQLISISLGTVLLLLVGFHYAGQNNSVILSGILNPAYIFITIIMLFVLPAIPACRAYIHREKNN